jgi:hypothetical protein
MGTGVIVADGVGVGVGVGVVVGIISDADGEGGGEARVKGVELSSGVGCEGELTAAAPLDWLRSITTTVCVGVVRVSRHTSIDNSAAPNTTMVRIRFLVFIRGRYLRKLDHARLSAAADGREGRNSEPTKRQE